ASAAELIRAGDNTLYRLPGGVVARVTRTGQVATAAKEVCVSRWLTRLGVPVVDALGDIAQPVAVEDRAVTFWRELPLHRGGTVADLADLLRRLHDLPTPDFDLPPLAPFVRLTERLTEAEWLSDYDRHWLLRRLADLQQPYA